MVILKFGLNRFLLDSRLENQTIIARTQENCGQTQTNTERI